MPPTPEVEERDPATEKLARLETDQVPASSYDSAQSNTSESSPSRLKTMFTVGALAVGLAAGLTAGSQAAPESANAQVNPANIAGAQTSPADTANKVAWSLKNSQQKSGHLVDRLGKSVFGDGMGGYAMLQTGVKYGSKRLIMAGLRATNYTTTHDSGGRKATRPFKIDAVASTYNLIKGSKLRHSPSAQGTLRHSKAWLQKQPFTYLRKNQGYENKFLVEAVAVKEAQKTGIKSKIPRTILAPDSRNIRKRADKVINSTAPKVAKRNNNTLSDEPWNPEAYHMLSAGYFARGVQLLGRSASGAARRTNSRLAKTIEYGAAPDGKLTSSGRSVNESWTQSAGAYSLAVIGKKSHSSTKLSLADRAIDRIGADYGGGPGVSWVTPALNQNYGAARKTVDPYTKTTERKALALNYLNRTNSLIKSSASSATALPDIDGSRVLSSGSGRFATVKSGDLWYAVRERALGSMRFDFGVVGMQKKNLKGEWENVMPTRPAVGGSAGPALYAGNGPTFPRGKSISVTGNKVNINGNYEYKSGKVARSGVRFSIEPMPNGKCVKTTVENPQAGDAYQTSTFFRGSNAPVNKNGVLYGSDGQAMYVDGGVDQKLSAEANYASASDAVLTRQKIVARSNGDKPFSLVQCKIN